MTKEEQLAIQHISNIMLDCGKFLEDIVHHKEEESSCAAFKRFKKGLLRNEKVEVCGKEITQKQLEAYCEFADNSKSVTPFISIPVSIPIYTIENALKKVKGMRWRDLTFKEKEEVLYQYGIDTKGENGSKYYVVRRMYRGDDNKVAHGLVIVGQERTDNEWKSSSKCSLEAYLHTNDRDFHKELTQMGRK